MPIMIGYAIPGVDGATDSELRLLTDRSGAEGEKQPDEQETHRRQGGSEPATTRQAVDAQWSCTESKERRKEDELWKGVMLGSCPTVGASSRRMSCSAGWWYRWHGYGG